MKTAPQGSHRSDARRPMLAAIAAFLLLGVAVDARIESIVVHSPALEGNLLGDPPDRSVNVYVPPGYGEDPGRRYSVLYLLHGYTANHGLWLGTGYLGALNIDKMTDGLIESGAGSPLLIVMPNADNTYWGSWYTNSSVTGNWEDFITGDLVDYIDTHYATLPQAASRGIAGHSMGGYGAIYLAMKHSEVYSAVYAMSAAAIAMEEHVVAPPSTSNAVLAAGTRASFGGKSFTDWMIKANIALAAAVAPNPDNPPFMADFPLEEVNGEVRVIQDVWQRWVHHDPLTMVGPYGSNLRQYRGVRIDCGTSDGLIGQNRLFSQALTDAGIAHDFQEYAGDHTNRIGQRLESEVLPFFSQTLATEEVTAVEVASWGRVKAGVGQ